MTEQQQWIWDLCLLVGYTPLGMPPAGHGISFADGTGDVHTVSISEDGLWVVGPRSWEWTSDGVWVVGEGWRVRVHDEQLPLSFRRAVESGKGDEMSDEEAKLALLKLAGGED